MKTFEKMGIHVKSINLLTFKPGELMNILGMKRHYLTLDEIKPGMFIKHRQCDDLIFVDHVFGDLICPKAGSEEEYWRFSEGMYYSPGEEKHEHLSDAGKTSKKIFKCSKCDSQKEMPDDYSESLSHLCEGCDPSMQSVKTTKPEPSRLEISAIILSRVIKGQNVFEPPSQTIVGFSLGYADALIKEERDSRK